jgi:glutathione-independent formaldehyde dehydrogenase
MTYNRQLMMAILHDRIQIAKAVNATAISLQDAPRGMRNSMPAPPRSMS